MGLSLPLSAKVDIPFPYTDSENGEQWILARDASNRFVVQVIDASKVVATFSVDDTNGIHSKAMITLGGQKYIVQNITVNSDHESGFVTLSKD